MNGTKLFLLFSLGTLLAGLSGCGAGGGGLSLPGANPVWEKSQTWTDLGKLSNFSLRATSNNSGTNLTYLLEQHSPDNFRLTESDGTIYVQAGGHRYYSGDGGKDFLDYGVTSPGSGTDGLEMTASAWQGIVENNATYAGPCTVTGLAGNSFRLDGVTATACVDATTGALLSGDLKGNGYEDTFQVTGIGDAPPIPAPSGARAHQPNGMNY